MNRHRRILLTVLLISACIMGGYGFYKMNPHDELSSVAFGVGLTGIALSVLRNSKS